MAEKTYTINLSGEDGASTSISLTSDVYEKLKTAFDELNNSCNYVSINITEPVHTKRVYCIRVTRTGRPIDGQRTIVSGYDIPINQTIFEILGIEHDKVRLFETSEDAHAYIESFKKNK